MPFGSQAEEWRNSASIPAWPAPFALPGVLAFRGVDSKRLMCRWRGAAVSAAGSAPVS